MQWLYTLLSTVLFLLVILQLHRGEALVRDHWNDLGSMSWIDSARSPTMFPLTLAAQTCAAVFFLVLAIEPSWSPI